MVVVNATLIILWPHRSVGGASGQPRAPGSQTGLGPGALGSHMGLPLPPGNLPSVDLVHQKHPAFSKVWGNSDSSPRKPTVILGSAFHPPDQRQSQRNCCSCGGCFIKTGLLGPSRRLPISHRRNPRPREVEWYGHLLLSGASVQVRSESSFPGPGW